MTLSEGWYVDGVRLDRWADVDDENGVTVENRTGWDDVPGLRGEDVTLLGVHGNAWRRKRYGPGRKTLTLAVNGVTAGTYGHGVPGTALGRRAASEQALDNLLRMFAPRHRLLSVERVHADGSHRRADCEVTSALTPVPVGDTAYKMSVELSVPGSFWEDVDPVTHLVDYDPVVGGSQDLEVYSLAGQTAPCTDAVVTVTGPCTTVSIVDAETGSGFSYGALSGAETLVVDSGAWTAVVGSTSVITSVALTDQVMIELGPAPSDDMGPSVTINATGTSAGFTVSFTTHRKWLR